MKSGDARKQSVKVSSRGIASRFEIGRNLLKLPEGTRMLNHFCLSGRVMIKVEPFPGVLLAVMLP